MLYKYMAVLVLYEWSMGINKKRWKPYSSGTDDIFYVSEKVHTFGKFLQLLYKWDIEHFYDASASTREQKHIEAIYLQGEWQ